MGTHPQVRLRQSVLNRVEHHQRPEESYADVVSRALDALESQGAHVTVSVDGMRTSTVLTADTTGGYTA